MKKVMLVLVLGCLFVVGCGKEKTNEDIMKEYAKNYYEKYMTSPDLDIAEVTIDMLKTANEQVNADYDLSLLSKCTNDSMVQLYVAKGTRTIDKYEYHLNCSK